MRIVKLFRSGRHQAVRLPREFHFEGDEVVIRRIGNAVILQPPLSPWDGLLAFLEEFSPDFMDERRQPSQRISAGAKSSL